MNDFELKRIKERYDEIRMSESDFSFIRNRLLKTMNKEKAVWGDRFSVFSSVPEKYLVAVRRVSVVFIAFIVIGAGASYAAEQSLPGDVLYSMKLNFNEPIVRALANSPEERAEVEVKFAGKRLEEAQKLNVQNRLDSETSKVIAEKFRDHANAAERATEEIVAKGDEITALDMINSLESVVVAHGEVLADALSDSASSTEILSEADKEAIELEQKRLAAEERMAKTEKNEQQRTANIQKIKASNKYDSVMNYMRFIDTQSEIYSQLLIDQTLEVVRLHLSYGEELFVAEDYLGAQKEFNEVIVILDSISVKFDLINKLEKIKRTEKKISANVIDSIATTTSSSTEPVIEQASTTEGLDINQ